MPKPKFVKPLLIGVACTAPVGLVVGLSINWDHSQFISAVGSSAVKPFIEKFGKLYHEQNSKFDVTVESGGTTFAVEQLVKGYTNIGNASNNPHENVVRAGYLDNGAWDNMKTLTLGWEGVALMYSLPNNLSQDAKDKFEIVINSDNIKYLYGIFSAYHEIKDGQWDSSYESLWAYAPKAIQDSITDPDDIALLQNTKILPFTRAGGNTGSNGCIAFSYYSNLIDYKNDLTSNQQKAFSGGQWGSDNDYMETDDSNARAWQSFVNQNKPASMVYLTTSFLTNAGNIKAIKDAGYKFAKYQGKPTSLPQSINLDDMYTTLSSIDTIDGYNWYRPINIMVNINDKKTTDFISWIFSEKEKSDYLATVYKLGCKPINEQEMQSMQVNDALFDKTTTDKVLLARRSGWYADLFGAVDSWE